MPVPSPQELVPKSPVLHRVRADGDGEPLLEYLLRRFDRLPARHFVEAVAEGRIRSPAGQALLAEDRLAAGQTLHAYIDVPRERGPAPPEAVELLFVDRHIVAVDKPSGLLCYPQGVHTAAAQPLAEAALAARGMPVGLRPLHRLDRETSGVLVFALHKESDRRIKKDFQRRRVAKTYIALIRGALPEGEQRVVAPIGPEGGDIRVRMAVRADGRHAETTFRTLARFGDEDHGEAGRGYSWVEARPVTGRTHQLRVHLAHLGRPIVGDKLYTGRGEGFLRAWRGDEPNAADEALGMDRTALHAWELVLRHPILGQQLRLRAPVPPDMSAFAEQRGGTVPAPSEFPGLPVEEATP